MKLRGFAAFIAWLLLSVAALAVTPQFWENFTQEDLLLGDLDHMSLTPEGALFLSPACDMIFDTGEPYIFSMVRDGKGDLYVGTGDSGKVFEVDPQGNGSLFFQADEINVSAMALDGAGDLYVGTSPDGKVYKVTAPNQATEFFDPKEKYIWSLLFDDSGNLYVGTGGGGLVYKVAPNGEKSLFYTCADTHVICLNFDAEGNLLAGTSPSGLLVKISSEGKGFTLLDTPMQEVHSIVFDANGGIYATALSSSAVSAKSSAATAKVETTPELIPTLTVVAADSVTGRGSVSTTVPVSESTSKPPETTSAVYRISKEGSAETIYFSKTQTVFDSVAGKDGSLLLATGPKGRLLSLDSDGKVTVLSDTPEERLTRMVADGDTVYAGGSSQGKVFKLLPERAPSGAYQSKILDAGKNASWGKIFWNVTDNGKTRFEFFTRTGNTEKIDHSWSDWSQAYSGPGQQISSPAARFLQWRAVAKRNASGADIPPDLLGDIRIAYLQKNLRPQVTKIEVLPYGIEFQRQPTLNIGGVSLVAQAATPDGRSFNAPRERGKNNLNPVPQQVLQAGAQSFTWKAQDENQDTLDYSIYFRGEEEKDWKLLEKRYNDTFYTIHGTDLPDGTYRIKVVASDAPSNPADAFLTGELISHPFVVANTPPKLELESREVKNKRVSIRFRACVTAGNIATAEFSVDGGEWYLLYPVDGIADSDCELFSLSTPDLSVGEHLVGIRASDRYGNTGIAKEIFRIP